MSMKEIFLVVIVLIGVALLCAGIISNSEKSFFRFGNKASIALGIALIGLAMWLR